MPVCTNYILNLLKLNTNTLRILLLNGQVAHPKLSHKLQTICIINSNVRAMSNRFIFHYSVRVWHFVGLIKVALCADRMGKDSSSGQGR